MPNPEIERLKLVDKVEILERNVAELEKQVAYLQARLHKAQGQLYDSYNSNLIQCQTKVINEATLDREISTKESQ